jgi:hypothetical protein
MNVTMLINTDMSPVDPVANKAYSRARNVVLVSKRLIGRSVSVSLDEDFADLGFGQFGISPLLPSQDGIRPSSRPMTVASGRPPSLNSLPHIARLRIGHQMRWAETPNSPAIAEMGDTGSLRRRLMASRQDVGHDVDKARTTFEGDSSIPIGATCSCPDPAWAKVRAVLGGGAVLVGLSPDSLFDGSVAAQAAAKTPVTYMPRRETERQPAAITDHDDRGAVLAGLRTVASVRRSVRLDAEGLAAAGTDDRDAGTATLDGHRILRRFGVTGRAAHNSGFAPLCCPNYTPYQIGVAA